MTSRNLITPHSDGSCDSSTSKGVGNTVADIESKQWTATGLDKSSTQDDQRFTDGNVDERVRNRYLWKLDFLILPTISACYFFEYLDRGNVAVRLVPSRCIIRDLN